MTVFESTSLAQNQTPSYETINRIQSGILSTDALIEYFIYPGSMVDMFKANITDNGSISY